MLCSKGWDLTGAQNLVHSTGLNIANLGFAGDSGGCVFRVDFAGASRGFPMGVGWRLVGTSWGLVSPRWYRSVPETEHR